VTKRTEAERGHYAQWQRDRRKKMTGAGFRLMRVWVAEDEQEAFRAMTAKLKSAQKGVVK